MTGIRAAGPRLCRHSSIRGARSRVAVDRRMPMRLSDTDRRDVRLRMVRIYNRARNAAAVSAPDPAGGGGQNTYNRADTAGGRTKNLNSARARPRCSPPPPQATKRERPSCLLTRSRPPQRGHRQGDGLAHPDRRRHQRRQRRRPLCDRLELQRAARDPVVPVLGGLPALRRIRSVQERAHPHRRDFRPPVAASAELDRCLRHRRLPLADGHHDDVAVLAGVHERMAFRRRHRPTPAG